MSPLFRGCGTGTAACPREAAVAQTRPSHRRARCELRCRRSSGPDHWLSCGARRVGPSESRRSRVSHRAGRFGAHDAGERRSICTAGRPKRLGAPPCRMFFLPILCATCLNTEFTGAAAADSPEHRPRVVKAITTAARPIGRVFSLLLGPSVLSDHKASRSELSPGLQHTTRRTTGVLMLAEFGAYNCS